MQETKNWYSMVQNPQKMGVSFAQSLAEEDGALALRFIWVVVKNMVPFWVPIIIRPLIFRVPKKGP